MNWEPISRESLEEIVAKELVDATPEERALFSRTAVTPSKWRLSPWGDAGGGFWVVAVMDDRVLWYNDIEEGFNVSHFTAMGHDPIHRILVQSGPAAVGALGVGWATARETRATRTAIRACTLSGIGQCERDGRASAHA
jgi:hypothetical protein